MIDLLGLEKIFEQTIIWLPVWVVMKLFFEHNNIMSIEHSLRTYYKIIAINSHDLKIIEDFFYIFSTNNCDNANLETLNSVIKTYSQIMPENKKNCRILNIKIHLLLNKIFKSD